MMTEAEANEVKSEVRKRTIEKFVPFISTWETKEGVGAAEYQANREKLGSLIESTLLQR